MPEFIYVEAPEEEREKKIVDTLFKFNGAGFAELPSGKNFSLPMSDTELQWLRAVLADEETAFLLPAPLRKKFLACLEKILPLYEKTFWRRIRAAQKISAGENFFDKLSVIVEALRTRRKIFCDDKNVAQVSLKVWNTRNAVERCFALFSSFDKKARLQDDGTYFLTVNYCLLDEEEIFEKIFSLGSAVTVVAPKNFRERIIEKFSAIQNLYLE